jgi:HEAT repeat protein
VDPLAAVLPDKSPWHARKGYYPFDTTAGDTVAEALGEIKDPRAIEPLRQLLKHDCSQAAVIALVRLELYGRLAGTR